MCVGGGGGGGGVSLIFIGYLKTGDREEGFEPTP